MFFKEKKMEKKLRKEIELNKVAILVFDIQRSKDVTWLLEMQKVNK